MNKILKFTGNPIDYIPGSSGFHLYCYNHFNFRTHVAGRNLGTILVWIIWLFVLITVLTPFLENCGVMYVPSRFFGDLFQSGSVTSVRSGKTGRFNNRFSGLNLKWPSLLDNSWLMLFSFLSAWNFLNNNCFSTPDKWISNTVSYNSIDYSCPLFSNSGHFAGMCVR